MSANKISSIGNELTPIQIEQGMRYSIWDGIFAQAFYGLTFPSSVFLTGFAILLGANNFEIGLIASLPPLLSGVNLVAARLLEKIGRRKKIYMYTAAIHRAVYLCLFVLPFTVAFMPKKFQIGLLLTVVLISTVVGSFQGTAWISWMADIIPPERRGKFFSRRNMLCSVLWMILSYVFGRIIDAHKTLMGYTIVFGSATVLALIALLFAVRQPDPPIVVSRQRIVLSSLWRDIFASREFRYFILFQLSWGLTVGLAGPFYNVYMLKSLQFTMSQITFWGIIGGIVGVATMTYWGLLGDNAGNKSTLLFCLLGNCFTSIGWLFVNEHNKQWLMTGIFALNGFFDTGVGLVSFNMLLGILPEKNKPTSIAFFEAIVGTVSGISPVLGGFLAVAAQKVNFFLFNIDSILLVVALSTILRPISILFLSRVPERGGHGFSFVVKEFLLANPFKLFSNLYLAQKSPSEKLAAIDTLSQMKSKAALPKLIDSIHDPNPRVRQRAVKALGEIGDPSALKALLEALNDPLEDIQAEAAIAIGKLGDSCVVPVLLKKLESADPHLQTCIASALGDLKATEATPKLVELLKSTKRTSVLLSCADALGRIGGFEALEPLLEVSRTVKTPTIKHSLVASIATFIDEDGKLYRALIQPEIHLAKMAEEILNPKTIKFAKAESSQLKKILSNALVAFHSKNYNEVLVQMKLINQFAVREYIAGKELKDAMGFEKWVRLLDSSYDIQIEVVKNINPKIGISLVILNYYSRHCPVDSEPDIDQQEFLVAIYAFKTAQQGLYQLLFGRNFLESKVIDKLKNLSELILKT